MVTNLVVCLMSVVTNFTPVKAWTHYDVNKPCFEEVDGAIRWNFHEETLYRPVVTTNFTYLGGVVSGSLERVDFTWTEDGARHTARLWNDAIREMAIRRYIAK